MCCYFVATEIENAWLNKLCQLFVTDSFVTPGVSICPSLKTQQILISGVPTVPGLDQCLVRLVIMLIAFKVSCAWVHGGALLV